jgi:nitronate monooxygenase
MVATELTHTLGIEVPLICGAMYPCSNPELVAAVSEAGGIGVVQPLSLTYVHGYGFREGLRYIRQLTGKPVGVNFIIEQSSKRYLERTRRWVAIALEEQIPLFVTALGNPRWVVDLARASGVTVYHDVTSLRWGEKALESGVDGLICVNDRAGGHAGIESAEGLYEALAPLGKPLICAGGIGDAAAFARVIRMGYAGAQLGTRFIASMECNAHPDYKQAIVQAQERDIVLTERLTGVPVAMIGTPHIDRAGTRAGRIARWLLRGPRTRHWMRTFYTLQSVRRLKHTAIRRMDYRSCYQAGKSVGSITDVQPVAAIVAEFAGALRSLL